jgi:hypothetical protein
MLAASVTAPAITPLSKSAVRATMATLALRMVVFLHWIRLGRDGVRIG